MSSDADKQTDKKLKKIPLADEDDPEVTYRVYSVFSYFLILVVLGIPVWWYTTRVYRASLPIDKMFNVEIEEISDKQFGLPLSLEYDVLITIVNPDPDTLEVNLNGEEIDYYLQPFLKTISPIANFVVKSQWLYLVELGAIPRKIEDHYALLEEQLPHVITPLEKKLFSHLSPRPCINLVLYIPHCRAPLFIYDKEMNRTNTNALISPRWGGIYVLNADKTSCQRKVFQPNMQQVISTFTTQLRKLLMINGSYPEHLKQLQYRRTLEMVNSSKRTLKSLAQLLSEISSIVISDDVAEKINVAMENVHLAEEYLKKNDVKHGLEHAKLAFNHSEAAFSDPSLLALLYFPDDQKYAVYIPLFLPVMIPVLMSLTTYKKWSAAKNLKVE